MLLVVSQVFYLDLGLGLAHSTYCMYPVLRHALWFGAEIGDGVGLVVDTVDNYTRGVRCCQLAWDWTLEHSNRRETMIINF